MEWSSPGPPWRTISGKPLPTSSTNISYPSGSRTCIREPYVSAIEADEHVVSTVGWIVELSDCLETRLLEGADRGPVTSIRPGDAGDRGRLREDEVADERPQQLGAEALARQLFLGDEEVDSGHPVAAPDAACLLRVAGVVARPPTTQQTGRQKC